MLKEKETVSDEFCWHLSNLHSFLCRLACAVGGREAQIPHRSNEVVELLGHNACFYDDRITGDASCTYLQHVWASHASLTEGLADHALGQVFRKVATV